MPQPNKFAAQLASDVRARFAVDASGMPHSEWICRNTTLRGLPFSFRKFPFQQGIVDDMHPNLSVKKISQVGLALDLQTPIATPTGWTTMGDLQEGDQVYGSDGRICNVTYVSPVYHERNCYELTFCDGEKIVADGNHRWFVYADPQGFSGVLSTEVLARNLGTTGFKVPAVPDLLDGDLTQKRRSILDIQRTFTRPVRCITVDAPNHLFLAGRGMVATHNTETQIRKAAAIVTRNRGRTLLFTFPNEDMQKKTSQTRIQPLITENEVFNKDKNQGIAQSRSVGIIQIGSSFLMINSCTEGEATSTPADAVFNDEVDLSDPAILALYASRMQASDWKIRQQFSTPTFSGYGIDQSYETSDQHEYFVKCDACNHWQVPLYDKKFVRIPGLPDSIGFTEIDQYVLDKHKIDLNQAFVACERCGAELDLGRSDNRNWVARHPHRTNSRGYHVRPFSVGTLSVAYIVSSYLEYAKKGFLRGWYNTVLGETYQDGDIRLTDAQIEACFADASAMNPQVPEFGTPCFIGIDIGLTCHIVLLAPAPNDGPNIMKMRAILFMAVPVERLMETVAELREKYLIVYGTVDRHPYTPTANDLFTETGGIIVPVEYRGHAEVRDKIETEGCLQANRTDLLDLVATSIRKQRLLIMGYGTQRETIKTHLKDMVREESPEKPAVWKKLSGSDHYFHALAYAYLAVKVYTGEYQGSASTLEKRKSVFVGGVGGEPSASATLSRMLGGQMSRGGMARVSRLR